MHWFKKGKEVGKFKVAVVMNNVVTLLVNNHRAFLPSIVLGVFHKIIYMLDIRYVTY
jgi:hypothetical protein